jgi:hypothetical protein
MGSAAAGMSTTSATTLPASALPPPDVGDLEFAYESVDMISEPGFTLTIYAAGPGARTAHVLALLG